MWFMLAIGLWLYVGPDGANQGKVENTGWEGVRVSRLIFGALMVVAPAGVN
jgi:hypothetical protein